MRSADSKEIKTGVVGLMFRRPVTGVETHEFTEMRRRPRAIYEVPAILEVVGVTSAGEGVQVLTRDVSEVGVRLMCAVAVPPASSVVLSMVAPCGTRLYIQGVIVRLKPLAEGEFELGVRFYEEELMLSAPRVMLAKRSK